MNYLHRLLSVASAAFFIVGSALAQNAGTIPANEVPVGKGPGITGFGSTYRPSGTGSLARTVRSKLEEVISVKDFGAKGDGSTDDSTAITNADAAAATAGKALYFPAGTYMAQGLNPRRSNLEWFGDGPYLSVIKAVNPGIGFDTLVWFGERSATSQYSNLYVHDLGFNGNGAGTNSVVEARNVTLSTFQNLQITGGSAQGLTTETSTATINTNLVRNHYRNIESFVNVGKGFYFRGEKDSEFTNLFAHNNNGDGIYIGPANLNSSALCETTEGYGSNWSARDNAGDGVVFDEAEKYVISSVQSSINTGYGLRFRSTFTGCTSTGSNSAQIANIVLRNNSAGAIRASDSAFVFGLKLGTVWIRGDNSTVGSNAVQLDGVQHSQFGLMQIEAWPGTALLIQQGTPLGVTTQSNSLQFGDLMLLNNGNAGSGTNHGISALNSPSQITINSLISQNTQTTGGNYELNFVNTVSQFYIGQALINAASAGNELNVGTADLHIGRRRTGSKTFLGGPAGSAERFTFGGNSPALSSCGTSPSIAGTDVAGQVTMGTGSPTGCTITFNVAYTNVPYCMVTWQSNLASMAYTVSNSAITLTQTGTSSNKVNYACFGQSGG
jgi:hypothetical protein